MAEYIERRKVAGLLCKLICGSDRGLCVSTPENCQQKRMLELYGLPVADVAPVRHGKWVITKEHSEVLDVDVTKHTCSACKDYRLSGYGLSKATNYCPNCGAKMDGD